MLLSCTGTVSAGTYSGGDGSSGTPYLLSSDSDIDELLSTSDDWGSYFKLQNDITLVGNHTPIGKSSPYFTGNFDGNGYSILNLTVYETTNYAGFFGYTTSSANIHDLGVEASSNGVVSTANYVGVLTGFKNAGIVNNCRATGNVSSSGTTVGGLVGINYAGTVSDSSASGSVNAGSERAGGLIGYSNGPVINCSSSGSANASQSVGSLIGETSTSSSIVNCSSGVSITGLPRFAGGLVGINSGTVTNSYASGSISGADRVGGLLAWSNGDVSDSYATGNVNGSGDYVGGFVGYNHYQGSINNCYATGSVTGNNEVGGLVGINYQYATISECFSTGSVTGNNEVGGLVGQNYDLGTVEYSYSSGDTTGSGDSVGGLIGYNKRNSDALYCFATGNATGNSSVGGLVGYNDDYSTIISSFATGNATGSSSVGGLVGYNTNNGVITRGYYSGSPANSYGSYTQYDNFQNYDFISGYYGLYWNKDGDVITTSSDSSFVWKIIDGYTLPYLQGQSAPAPLAPYVATISQSSGSNYTDESTSFWINVTGSCFNITDTVFVNLTMDGQTPLSGTIDNITYTTINATFNLTQAIAGDWSLYVINPDGQTSTAKTFTVTMLSAPESFTNTTGNFWVNHSWSAGTGDVTDFYNMSYDGGWQNSTLTYFNHTGLSAHAWSNITVYAYNATYSMLSAEASDNVQIPNNEIGILNVTNITTGVGASINFDINFTDADGDTPTFDCNQSSLFDSFNTSTGEGSWNIGLDEDGTYYVEFNVSDGYGSIDSQVMTITVEPISAPESFTNNTGNFWVNHSWNAGTGQIVTDSYNVSYNVSWLNGTTNSFNHTGLYAHAWSNITVYAYNATYSSLSDGINDSVQVPNNEISILNATDITTSEGEAINFDINFTDVDGDTATFDCNQSSLFDDFNTSTGEGSWDIGFSDAGTYYVEFNVSDGYGSVDSQVMTITVADTSTIYVGSGSDCDFTTIQAAVNAANSGNTIIVTDGTYNENVDVNKTVTLRSENGSATTNVNASDSLDYVFNVTVSNVTIDGFNVTGVTNFEAAGIYLAYSNNSIVRNNVVNNNSFGIVLDHSENGTLSSNIANNNNYYGIYLSSSSHTTLDDNDIYNNNYGIGLSSSSNYNTLTDNVAMNNTIYGMYFTSSDNNTLTGNDASYNEQYGMFFSSSHNNTLTDNVASYNIYTNIASASVDSVIEPMNGVTGAGAGIYIGYSDNNVLIGNIANYNEGSISILESSSSNAVSPNAEGGSLYSCGFSLYNSENTTLTGNTAIGNEEYAFYSRSSYNCTVDNLEIDANSMELSFVPTHETAIRSNETISTGPSGKSNVNGYLDIGLLEDMNMTIFYDDLGMSSSIESSVTLYKLNGNEWVAVPNATLNTSGNFVSVILDSGVSVHIAPIGDYTSTYGLFRNVPSSSSGSDDDGVRASVSQGQDPKIVSQSASSVKRVTGGSEVEYDFSDSGTPVLGVSFDAKDDKGLVVAKVQILSSNPSGVPSPSGKSYQMLSIDVGSEGTISSDSAENVMIHFKVSKQWIEENNIDLSTIRMTRYHDEQWNSLPTSQESEDDEYIYFYAETPGFSVFNVVGDEIGESSEQAVASESVTEEVEEPAEEEETSDTPGFTAFAGVVFVSLAFLVSRKE
jgi:PGF-pre-PGF domain-containing protein